MGNEQPGLYENYQDWGVISGDDANGGFVPIIKGGVVFDSRDNKPNPMKGIWTEAVLVGAPVFLGAESAFAKLKLTHRQYFTIVPDWLHTSVPGSESGYQTCQGENQAGCNKGI